MLTIVLLLIIVIIILCSYSKFNQVNDNKCNPYSGKLPALSSLSDKEQSILFKRYFEEQNKTS